MTFARLALLLLIFITLVACQAIVDDVSDDIAENVSEEVVKQVGTAVVDGVATALSERQDAPASESGAPAVSASPSPHTFSCESKTCGEMESCEEALYHLNFCGHSRRDSDNDGIPCESICSSADVQEATEVPAATSNNADALDETGLVTRVIDGDTIDVLLDGVNTRIRYLQMNTPERDEPCYRESTQANANLVHGEIVRLVPDKELVGPYGRLLRYVFIGDLLINQILVEQGYAEVVLYPPNDALYVYFRSLEEKAAAAGLGCHPTGIFDDGTWTR